MIKDDIKNYAKQFEYEPEVINAEKLSEHNSYVIGGMGGSGLVAGILRSLKPELNIIAHHEYGLPTFLKHDKERRLYVAISYSGNTEETVDFYNAAAKVGNDLAVIAAGGELLKLAEKDGAPFVRLPEGEIQPRVTLGFMLRALLRIISDEALYEETGEFAKSLKPEDFLEAGNDLGDKLFGKLPVVYSSRDNHTLAFNWKIKFNETGKIPAFYNTFPELNHNEMQGFDVANSTKGLSDRICFVFLDDDEDHGRIKKRMKVTSELYKARGLHVENVKVKGESRLEKIFGTLILGDWVALRLSEKYNTEPEAVPMVEEFKKIL